MTQRVLGPEGSPRRRWTLLLPLAVMIALGLFYAVGAQAVHSTGAFELDGDAVNAAGTPGDDWDNVCHQVLGSDCSTTGNTNTATAVSWKDDGALNASIFTGGGSKDPQDINQWAWKDDAGGLPDKDNLLHSFAARYSLTGTNKDGTCPNGTDLNGGTFNANTKCEVLFFGSDRYDNSGDAQQGFWFFQNKITLGSNAVGGGTGFNGVHKNGDLLVISDFSNGGGTSIITVYSWDSSCLKGETKPVPGDCGDANLRLKATSDLALCSNTLQQNDGFCGIVNPTNGTTAPWPYTDKSGNSTYLQGELYEGGINLSLLGLGNECFASVASESRSSTSTTATLKDFVLDTFAPCGAALTTAPDKTSFEIGGTVQDSAKISVSGLSSPPAPTGTVTFYLCGPSQTQISTCDSSGAAAGTASLANATKSGNDYTVKSNTITPTSAGYYCFFATWPGDGNYQSGPYSDGDSSECFQVTPKTPSISTQVSTTVQVTPGTAVSDTATLTGLATPSNATQGTITFRAYGPDDATCATTAVYTSVANVSAGKTSYNSATDGNGGSFAPTTPGKYRWRAFYAPATGDVNNVAVSTACNDANEDFTVQQFQPTLSTVQTWTIKDKATISVAGGGNLTGTAHFGLYTTTDCTGSALYTEDVPVSGASAQNPETTPFTITTSKPTLYWKVSYSSTNGAHKDIAATCTENSSVTITN